MRKLILLLCLLPLAAYGQTAVGNITILGATCAVTNACVVDALSAGASSASITLTGTWTATVQFEASPDGGTTWVAINGTPPSSTTAVTSATANGVWTFNVGSMTHLRARASALASGTVGVNINASPAPIMAGGGGVATSVSSTAYPLRAPDGSQTTPSYSFTNCTACGMWQASGAIVMSTTSGDAVLGGNHLFFQSPAGTSTWELNGNELQPIANNTQTIGDSSLAMANVTSVKYSTKTTTVGALPSAASNAGAMIGVSDSTTVSAEGQTCVGSGAVTALAFSNGTVWKCF